MRRTEQLAVPMDSWSRSHSGLACQRAPSRPRRGPRRWRALSELLGTFPKELPRHPQLVGQAAGWQRQEEMAELFGILEEAVMSAVGDILDSLRRSLVRVHRTIAARAAVEQSENWHLRSTNQQALVAGVPGPWLLSGGGGRLCFS